MQASFMLLKSAKRVRNVVVFMAAVVAAGSSSFWFSSRHGIERIHHDAERRLDSFRTALFAPTDKYSYLPSVVAHHPVVIEALLNKDDPQRLAKANTLLETLNTAAQTAVVYITDDSGLTIAASNWKESQSFVGNNFSFRPYFLDAMNTGTGRFYGMGMVTFAPGYYISHKITHGSAVLGVAVVKVDLTNLDEEWDRSNGEITVSDSNGVIFLSSRKDWKYQPTRSLQEDVMEKLIRTRQYEGVLKELLPMATVKTLAPDARIVKIAEPIDYQHGQEGESYLVKSRRLPDADWTIDLYTPMKANEAWAMRTATGTAGAFAFALLLIIHLRLAAGRIKERERSRLELEGANRQLELKNRELQAISGTLLRISITDHLTGAYTRRFFYESLVKLMSAARRHGTPLSVIMIDVDNFKHINDTYGHPVGDEVLQILSSTCREALRTADVFSRFGGEEFIIALPDTDECAAHEVAERLRLGAMLQPIAMTDATVHLTISCGIAQFRASDFLVEDMIKRADQALYAAKNTGRNRVVVHSPLTLIKTSAS
ncbi:MAG: hypothetical protein V7606_4678 [Burkholderiales bacterium]